MGLNNAESPVPEAGAESKPEATLEVGMSRVGGALIYAIGSEKEQKIEHAQARKEPEKKWATGEGIEAITNVRVEVNSVCFC